MSSLMSQIFVHHVYEFIHGVLYRDLFAHMISALFDILLCEYTAIYQFWC